MSAIKRDPLLISARIVLAILFGLLIFAMVMLAIGIAACVFLPEARTELMAELLKVSAPAGVYWAIIAIMLLIEGLLALGLLFIRQLSRIVRSVDAGDPFVPDNADRLSRMGWLTLGAYGLSLVIGVFAARIHALAADAGEFDFSIGSDLGGGGILLILTLFILARVFRQGSAMREELEGTV